jgi:hypothetical protein
MQRLEFDGAGPDAVGKLRQIVLTRLAAFPALATYVITDLTGKCLATGLPMTPCQTRPEHFRRYSRFFGYLRLARSSARVISKWRQFCTDGQQAQHSNLSSFRGSHSRAWRHIVLRVSLG